VGFTAWTTWLSFTPSDLMPEYDWAGLRSYRGVLRTENTEVAYINLLIYSIGFVGLTTLLGFVLAVLIDQRIRAENLFRTIYLYPLACRSSSPARRGAGCSIPVSASRNSCATSAGRISASTGSPTAISRSIRSSSPPSGMARASPWRCSWRPALDRSRSREGGADRRRRAGPLLPAHRRPGIAPIAISVLVILLQFAIKTFDLVRAMTGGGPGIATMLPAVVVYDFMFQRGQLGRGSAAAVLLLLSLLVVLLPYYAYAQWRARRDRANG
jgi:glucose/mannose transport system permease protein